MNNPNPAPRYFRTVFPTRECPHCHRIIFPEIRKSIPNKMHGYKLFCPECQKWIGWGGKTMHCDLAAIGSMGVAA